MRYIEKPTMISEAEQWFKNGDHSKDACEMINPGTDKAFLSEGKMVRYFRHPGIPDESACPDCGCIMQVHGWVDPAMWRTTRPEGLKVCPGSYITEAKTSESIIYGVIDQDSFEKNFMQYPKLNPAEALFGFLAYLTTRDEPITMSAYHDAGTVIPILNEWMKVQKLGKVTDRWPNNMVPMKRSVETVKAKLLTDTPLLAAEAEFIDLLKRAAFLVGNPGTNISGSTDDACNTWQKDLRAVADKLELTIETFER